MKVFLEYKLIGAVIVDVQEEKTNDYDFFRELVDSGEISDQDLIEGIESTDTWGIEGDAIEITGVSTLNGEQLADFK